MGEYNSTKLRWLIVGTSADDGTITALSEEDRTAFGLGLMLNKTYVMLSEKLLRTQYFPNPPFQNKYTDSGDYLNDYGYFAQDYATSNIRQYLTGKTVKGSSKYDKTSNTYTASGTDKNIMTDYKIDKDPMYTKIKARSLISLYNESAISGKTKDMLTVPTSKVGYKAVDFTGDTADRLWLLSQTEMQEIFKADYRKNNLNVYVYMSSITSMLNKTDGALWWLRSPSSSNNYWVCCVQHSGDFYESCAYDNTPGVRPAFLF